MNTSMRHRLSLAHASSAWRAVMNTREYVIKWHRGDRSPSVGEAVERWARVLSLALIPVVLGVAGHFVSQRVARQQVDLEYVKTALTVLRSEDSDERLRRWAVEVINKFSEVSLATDPELQSALESGAIVLPSLGVPPLEIDRSSHRWLWMALLQFEELPPGTLFSDAGELKISNLKVWQSGAQEHPATLALATRIVKHAKALGGASIVGGDIAAITRLVEILRDETKTLRDLAEAADEVLKFPSDKK
jgi:hypothetical protein